MKVFVGKVLVLVAAATLLLLTAKAWADTGDYPMAPPPSETERAVQAEIGYSNDTLSNGRAPWSEEYLRVYKAFGKGENFYGAYRMTNRFSLTDQEIMLGGTTNLSPNWHLNLEASISPTHNVLAQWTGSAELYHAIASQWGIYFGEQYRQYNNSTVNANVNIQNVGIEHYFGNWRLAYTFRLSEVSGTTQTGTSHSLELDDYYADQDKIGLLLVGGQEVDNNGPSSIILGDVRTAMIVGAHWFSPTWGMTYGFGVNDFHPFYTRTTFQVGVAHKF